MDSPSYEEARLTAGCANLGSVAAYFDIIHFLDIAREQTQHLERVQAMFTATERDLANLVALTWRSQRALGNMALEELRRAKALRDALEGVGAMPRRCVRAFLAATDRPGVVKLFMPKKAVSEIVVDY